MDSWEYCREVLTHIPRATRRERQVIRRELTDHLADGAEVCAAAGCPEEEAQARAVEAMGDPAETGKALNAQLSPFWLWLGRGCLLLAAGCCALLLVNQDRARWTVKNLIARFAPFLISGEMGEYTSGYEYSEKVNLRIDLGEDVLQIYQVYLDEDGWEPRAGLRGVAYSKDIHGYGWSTAAPWYTYLRTHLCVGGETKGSSVMQESDGAVWISTAVQPGDTYVTLRCEAYGEQREWDIPLPKEVGR